MNKERSLEEILHFRLDRDDKVLVKWAELFEEYCVKNISLASGHPSEYTDFTEKTILRIRF